MASIIVRNIEDEVVRRLDELAEAKEMSRETYLRGILKNHVMAAEIREVENRYGSLVEKTAAQLNVLTDSIEKNNYYVDLKLEQLNKGDG